MVAIDIKTIDRQFGAFRRRVVELKGTSTRSPVDEALEATLAELELAEEELQVCLEEIDSSRSAPGGRVEDEWRLLSKVFADLPVAVFLLAPDGSIRRSNEAGADLVGGSQQYLSRRPLAGLIELSSRPAFRTQLSRVVRHGGVSRVPVRLATAPGSRNVLLVLKRMTSGDETQQMVLAVAQDTVRRPEEEKPVAELPTHISALGTASMPGAYASVARVAIGAAVRANQVLTEARAMVAGLSKALESRAVIGQATGIVMAQRGLTADKAFEVLVRDSQRQNVKLVQLARLLVSDADSEGRLRG